MKYIIFFFLLTNLFSASLKSSYTIFSNEFNASVIDNSIKNDFIIYTFDKNRHKKSFYAKELVQLFENRHLKLEPSPVKLIHVKHVSNVNLNPIKQAIREYYLSFYPKMRISSIEIKASSFIDALPLDYHIEFKSNAYRYASSSLFLKDTKQKKRYFINYRLFAELKLLKARHNINRGKILSQIDVISSYIKFKRLKAKPFTFKKKQTLELKNVFLQEKFFMKKTLKIFLLF